MSLSREHSGEVKMVADLTESFAKIRDGQVLIFMSPGYCMLLINDAIEIYRANN